MTQSFLFPYLHDIRADELQTRKYVHRFYSGHVYVVLNLLARRIGRNGVERFCHGSG